MRSPSLNLERTIGGVIAGVDEAGCAPLAGPVVAAAVVLPRMERRPRSLQGLTDSKLLTREEREKFFGAIVAISRVGIGAASVAEIDRVNIYNADMLAMKRAVAALRSIPDVVLVDGNRAPTLACPVRTLIKGDQRCLSIAAASVVAKVTRDRLMGRLARRHPGYGWDTNMGYPTDDHYLGLLRLGPTPHHRRSFAPVCTLFDTNQLRLELSAAPSDPTDLGCLQMIFLREDLHSVCIEAHRPVGALKRIRNRWVFRAFGTDAEGNLVPGAGPFGRAHEREIAAPNLRALRQVLRSALSGSL